MVTRAQRGQLELAVRQRQGAACPGSGPGRGPGDPEGRAGPAGRRADDRGRGGRDRPVGGGALRGQVAGGARRPGRGAVAVHRAGSGQAGPAEPGPRGDRARGSRRGGRAGRPGRPGLHPGSAGRGAAQRDAAAPVGGDAGDRRPGGRHQPRPRPPRSPGRGPPRRGWGRPCSAPHPRGWRRPRSCSAGLAAGPEPGAPEALPGLHGARPEPAAGRSGRAGGLRAGPALDDGGCPGIVRDDHGRGGRGGRAAGGRTGRRGGRRQAGLGRLGGRGVPVALAARRRRRCRVLPPRPGPSWSPRATGSGCRPPRAARS